MLWVLNSKALSKVLLMSTHKIFFCGIFKNINIFLLEKTPYLYELTPINYLKQPIVELEDVVYEANCGFD